MLHWGVVHWHENQVPFGKLDRLTDEGDFYAVIAGARSRSGKTWDPIRVLYVGIAYNQPVVRRIRQDHQSYERVVQYVTRHREHDLFVMVGDLMPGVHSVERVTRQFVEDVEGLLIYRNKPPLNTRGVNEYTGRDLVVMNAGDYAPLKETSACCSNHFSEFRASGEYGLAKRYSRP